MSDLGITGCVTGDDGCYTDAEVFLPDDHNLQPGDGGELHAWSKHGRISHFRGMGSEHRAMSNLQMTKYFNKNDCFMDENAFFSEEGLILKFTWSVQSYYKDAILFPLLYLR